MADVINEMVAQRKMIRDHMRQRMESRQGMMHMMGEPARRASRGRQPRHEHEEPAPLGPSLVTCGHSALFRWNIGATGAQVAQFRAAAGASAKVEMVRIAHPFMRRDTGFLSECE